MFKFNVRTDPYSYIDSNQNSHQINSEDAKILMNAIAQKLSICKDINAGNTGLRLHDRYDEFKLGFV